MNPVVRWFHQLGSPPTFDRFAARWAPWCYGLGVLLMGWGLYGALFQVPADYQQGDSFRILYIHVPSAWMSLAVYGLIALAGKAQIPPTTGLVLTVAGMIAAYLGPLTLSKRWKSPDA